MKTYLIILALVVGAGVLFRLISPSGAPLEPQTISGKVRHVTDGDSLYIGREQAQIRLWGVDAPESDEPGYQAAKSALTRFAYGKRLKCRKITNDKYGRIVARCFLKDGREINRMMIESGTAQEFLRYSKGFYSR